jgi:hypothetical protein
MAVYPVDVRGLINSEFERRFSAAIMMPRQGRGTYQRLGTDADRQIFNTFDSFANNTGGKACYNRTEVEICFRSAAEDSREYYMLGFYLASDDRKSGWHRLQVKTDKPHVQVRARNGFYVTSSQAISPESLKEEVGLAMVAPLNYTAVPVQVQWSGTSQQNGKSRAEFVVSLPAQAITIDVSNGNEMDLEITALAFGHDGKTSTELAKNLHAKLKPESLAKIRGGGLNYRDALALTPGKYTVKFVVRDNLSGKVGSVAAPLEIAP